MSFFFNVQLHCVGSTQTSDILESSLKSARLTKVGSARPQVLEQKQFVLLCNTSPRVQ